MQIIKSLFRDYFIWSYMGMSEIKKRYRRSLLGPFWLVLSNVVVVFSLSAIYSIILKKDFDWYVVYLGIGFVIWQFISSCLSESTEYFIKSSNLIKTYRISVYNYVFREIGKNFIFLIHNLPFWILIIIFYNVDLSLNIITIIFSYVLIFLNAIWVSSILALISTRYRDLSPIVSTLVQLSFFATPVLWDVGHIFEIRPDVAWIVYFNPFYHILEIFRAPIMNNEIPYLSFVVCLVFAVFGNIFSSLIFNKYSRRIVFWL